MEVVYLTSIAEDEDRRNFMKEILFTLSLARLCRIMLIVLHSRHRDVSC